MDFSTLNWLAIVVATLLTFVIGAIWYGPLFGKPWMKEMGFTEEDLKDANMAMIYGTAFVLELIMTINLALFIGDSTSIMKGLAVALQMGLGFIALAMAVNALFSRTTIRLWFINAFYFVVCFLLNSTILVLWK